MKGSGTRAAAAAAAASTKKGKCLGIQAIWLCVE